MFATAKKTKATPTRAAGHVSGKSTGKSSEKFNDGIMNFFKKPVFRQPLTSGMPAQRYTASQIQQIKSAVATAMGASGTHPAMTNFVLVFHPPTPQESWQYTRTVSGNVTVGSIGTFSVRGHVHYTNGVAGPGNMWISGVDNHSFSTPNWVVQQFAVVKSSEKTSAVQAFNTRHGTHKTVL